MACFGSESPRWQISLENQKIRTNHMISLRQWLVNEAGIDDSFVEDMPGFHNKLREDHRLDERTARANPSSYMPSYTEKYVTQNEEAKLCQVIRHLGENKFYEIIRDAGGVRNSLARETVDFWESHKIVDEKRIEKEELDKANFLREAAIQTIEEALQGVKPENIDSIVEMVKQEIQSDDLDT